MSNEVLVVTGAGGIGQAIVRRQGPGKSVLLADFNEETLARSHGLQRSGSCLDPSRWPLAQRAGPKEHEQDARPQWGDIGSRTVAKTLPRPAVTPRWFVGARRKAHLAGIFDALEWTRATTLYI
jgi:hypothetical protein